MSRSGYSDDCTGWALIRWRGAVQQAVRGRRGQAFLRELIAALDALPEPRLAAGVLMTRDGCYCALGAVGHARCMDLTRIDPDDREAVAQAFGVSAALAAEIMDVNDVEGLPELVTFNFEVCGPMRPWESHTQLRWSTNERSGSIRWKRMRAWAVAHLKMPDAGIQP